MRYVCSHVSDMTLAVLHDIRMATQN